MGKRMWMLVATVWLLASTAMAGTGSLQFVETDVILYPNGQASVKYTVRYRVLSGEFHGFYFGRLDRLKAYFDTETAFGIDSGGRQIRYRPGERERRPLGRGHLFLSFRNQHAGCRIPRAHAQCGREGSGRIQLGPHRVGRANGSLYGEGCVSVGICRLGRGQGKRSF